MRPEATFREHFKLLRSADQAALADYHCNLLYGYLQALSDTDQIRPALLSRLRQAVTKAWSIKTYRLHGFRRAA